MYTQTPITVFNRRLGADRRDIYIPTCIRSASYMESIGSSGTDGARNQAHRYRLRIPASTAAQGGRVYLPEADYRLRDDSEALSYWTLQTGDYIIPHETELTDPVDAEEMRSLAAPDQLITITEYADNTIRGSWMVQHWRIEGA